MLIQKTGATQVQINTTNPQHSNAKMGEGMRMGTAHTGQMNLGTGKLQEVEVSLSFRFTSTRDVDNKVTDTAARIIHQMKSQLDTIVKNYPPFAMDDPRRGIYLKSFIGLRQEIERMTIPKDVKIPKLSPISTDADVAAAADKLDIVIKKINDNIGENMTEGGAREVSVKTGADLKAVLGSMTTQPKVFLPFLG